LSGGIYGLSTPDAINQDTFALMFESLLPLYLPVIAISILHAILPNHWLPVVAISKQVGWSVRQTAGITMLAALAHSLSTVIIGILIGLGGRGLENILPQFQYVSAVILIGLGILFLWRHQHHMHFHMRDVEVKKKSTKRYLIGSILLAMFMSPCLEVSALFLISGPEGLHITLVLGLIYTITSAIGMTLFAWLSLQGLKKVDWHKVEHNSGLISGLILILSGIMFLFLK
jgi:cytochrome c biogenesis protein CcdA